MAQRHLLGAGFRRSFVFPGRLRKIGGILVGTQWDSDSFYAIICILLRLSRR